MGVVRRKCFTGRSSSIHRDPGRGRVGMPGTMAFRLERCRVPSETSRTLDIDSFDTYFDL